MCRQLIYSISCLLFLWNSFRIFFKRFSNIYLCILKGMVQKVCRNCFIVYCSQSCTGKFFGFHADGSHRCAIYLIDVQVELLLRNTLFFTPLVTYNLSYFFEILYSSHRLCSKTFYIFGRRRRGNCGHQCGNLMSSLRITFLVVLISCNKKCYLQNLPNLEIEGAV